MAGISQVIPVLVLVLALPLAGQAGTAPVSFNQGYTAGAPGLDADARLSMADGWPLSLHQHRSLALSEDLLRLADVEGEPFHRAIAVAQRATRGQAEVLGYPWGEPEPLRGYSLPSHGLRELADRAGVTLTPEQDRAVEALETEPEPFRAALARFVDAFLAMDAAVRASRNVPPESSLDWSPVFPARVQFLDAIARLRDAIPMSRDVGAGGCNQLDVPLAFRLDLGGCDTISPYPYRLQLDLGGTDRYVLSNNAGGSSLGANCGGDSVPAASVDLGDGNDNYGSPGDEFRLLVRWCGYNGAGYGEGSGFLLDEGGDDLYVGTVAGVNGGGYRGTGFLLDIGGDDNFTTQAGAVNGGSSHRGIGMLLDLTGDDRYLSHEGNGANGGGSSCFTCLLPCVFGHCLPCFGCKGAAGGFLVDLEGNDAYEATTGGANGGAAGAVLGFLLDRQGDDNYRAGHYGTNGGGISDGQGFLLDVAGHDRYAAASYGTNGGGAHDGAGFLRDLGGDDTYFGEGFGSNGGASAGPSLPLLSLGALLDEGGHDRYLDDLVDCTDCSVVPKGTLGAQFDVGPAPRGVICDEVPCWCGQLWPTWLFACIPWVP